MLFRFSHGLLISAEAQGQTRPLNGGEWTVLIVGRGGRANIAPEAETVATLSLHGFHFNFDESMLVGSKDTSGTYLELTTKIHVGIFYCNYILFHGYTYHYESATSFGWKTTLRRGQSQNC